MERNPFLANVSTSPTNFPAPRKVPMNLEIGGSREKWSQRFVISPVSLLNRSNSKEESTEMTRPKKDANKWHARRTSPSSDTTRGSTDEFFLSHVAAARSWIS